MSKYRDRLQIIANILSISSRKAKKTQIMYQANLSYKLLCRYLIEVTEAGLVNLEDKKHYVLTRKGREFLNRHEEYTKRCRNLEERLNDVNDEKVALIKMCSDPYRVHSKLSRLDNSERLKKS